MNDIAEKLKADLDAALEDAYRRGFTDGGEAMRASILKAATAPLNPDQDGSATRRRTGSTFKLSKVARAQFASSVRAKHGTVQRLTRDFLQGNPGSTWRAIADAVVKGDPTVSASSVGTELRRGLRQGRYRHDGALYFLVGREIDQEAAEEPHEASSADPHSDREEVRSTEPP